MPKSLDMVVNGIGLKYIGARKVVLHESGQGSRRFQIPQNATVYETLLDKPSLNFYYFHRRNIASILADDRFHRVPRGAAAMEFGIFYFDGGRKPKPFYDNPKFYNSKGVEMIKCGR